MEDIVTFGPELVGTGWLEIQVRQLSNGRLDDYRWTGARPSATFNFLGYDHPVVDIAIELVAIASPHVIRTLTIQVDGQPVPFTFETTNGGYPMHIKLRAPRDRTKPVSTLSLQSSRTWKPRDVIPGATDGRDLALAVYQARITAAKGDSPVGRNEAIGDVGSILG